MNRMYRLYQQWLPPLLSCIFLLGMAAVLPACGGSSDGKALGDACQSTQECASGLECRGKKCRTPLPDNPPVAIANVDPTDTEVNQKVNLDGSGSSDPENQPLTYKWMLAAVPDGSQAKIAAPAEVTTSFTPDLPGDYKVQLEVSDGKNKKTSVAITVRVKESENTKPAANAGEDVKVEPGEVAKLDGSASSDPDGDDISYRWKFVTKPQSSKTVLEKADTAKPQFTADVAGKYVVELEVTDARKATATDRVTVDAIENLYLEPKVTSVSPAKGTIETTVDITIKGEKLADGATVTLGRKQYPTKFQSDTELKATLDLSGQTPGDADLLVTNPNGKSSPPIKFQVLDIPTPELTKLEPNFSFEGVKEVTIKVIGKNFVSTSEVLFSTTPLLTTYKSETELEARLDLTQTTQGEYDISVRSPGGRISPTKLTFKVLQPQDPPVLRVLNPPSAKAGEKIDFSVHGTGFAQGAVIVFDGKEIPSKRLRRDEIQADPKLDLSQVTEGEYKVWVKNPDGKISAKDTFNVIGINPVPRVDRILPFTVLIGTKTTLAIYGSRFDKAKAKFFIDGKEYAVNTQRSSASYLEAEIDATKGTWKSGNFDAYVVNPGPTPDKDKKSNIFKLTITHPTPSIDAVTPGGWSLGCDTDVQITGRNFVQSTKLYFGSTIYTTNASNPEFKITVNSAGTQIDFKLYKKNLSLTTYKVYLENGPGAKSSTADFKIRNSNEIPDIRELRPGAGAADTTVSVLMYYKYPNYFRPGAIAYLDGKKMPTTCRLSSSSEYCYDITAIMDLSGVSVGTHQVAVANPCGKPSQALSFIVTAPPDPMVAQFVPSHGTVGTKSALTLKGVNFSKNAKLLYGNSTLALNVKSDEEATTQRILDFKYKGSVDIYLDNGNGKKTTKIPFEILDANASPTITKLADHTLKRGEIHKNVIIQGSGFTKNTKVYFDGKVVASTFTTTAQISIDQLDFRTIAPGTYIVQVEENGKKSNPVTLLAEPLPPPSIRYLSPASRQSGQYTSTYLYIYGDRFCTATRRCSTNPKVTITGPDKKDYSNKFSISYSYTTYIRGNMNLQGIPTGAYQFVVQLPTGEKSAPGVFQLTPPPPPTASSVSPSSVYRGNDSQQVNISGANFDKTQDVVIFNNNKLNRIAPSSSSSTTSLTVTLDISKLKYAGRYPLYVLRCKDANCTKFDKTKEVFLTVQDPQCNIVPNGCGSYMPPANSEGCATVSGIKVCRPKCTSTSFCANLTGAPTGAKCVSGYCQ